MSHFRHLVLVCTSDQLAAAFLLPRRQHSAASTREGGRKRLALLLDLTARAGSTAAGKRFAQSSAEFDCCSLVMLRLAFTAEVCYHSAALFVFVVCLCFFFPSCLCRMGSRENNPSTMAIPLSLPKHGAEPGFGLTSKDKQTKTLPNSF